MAAAATETRLPSSASLVDVVSWPPPSLSGSLTSSMGDSVSEEMLLAQSTAARLFRRKLMELLILVGEEWDLIYHKSPVAKHEISRQMAAIKQRNVPNGHLMCCILTNNWVKSAFFPLICWWNNIVKMKAAHMIVVNRCCVIQGTQKFVTNCHTQLSYKLFSLAYTTPTDQKFFRLVSARLCEIQSSF